MKGIVLVSHGGLADGMLEAVHMFAGEPEQITSLGLMPGEDMAAFAGRLREAAVSVDTGDGVTVFCDLLFGTPCNCSAALLRGEEEDGRVQIITGANLPMVIEYVTARGAGMDPDAIVSVGREGIVDYNALARERAAKA